MDIRELTGASSAAPNNQQSQTASYSGPLPWAEAVKRVVFAATDQFEGGKPDSLQTRDSGIISYGRHQATLQSGSLEAIINNYKDRSPGTLSKSLDLYSEKIASKDPTLRNDKKFLELLKKTALDPQMQLAQSDVFSKNYWQPAVKTAQDVGIESPLGFLIYYDTNIQGGLATISNKTVGDFERKGETPDEQTFLTAFLGNRRDYLLSVAANKREAGDLASAHDLTTSTQTRIVDLENLVGSGNLALADKFKVKGAMLDGLNYQ